MLNACFRAFCDTIEAAGYDAMIYFHTSTAYANLDMSMLYDYDSWYASYNKVPEFYYYFDMWQYSSSGIVDGIPVKVDMNLSFTEY